jgi:hypothetical protein
MALTWENVELSGLEPLTSDRKITCLSHGAAANLSPRAAGQFG